MSVDLDRLRSPEAIACRRQVAGEMGGAIIHCIVLADGELIECGSDYYAEQRAKMLAEAVNAFGADKFRFWRAAK